MIGDTKADVWDAGHPSPQTGATTSPLRATFTRERMLMVQTYYLSTLEIESKATDCMMPPGLKGDIHLI
jgi:hypothetical protein